MFRLLRYIFLTLLISLGLPVVVWFAGYLIFCVSISSFTTEEPEDHLDAAIVLTGGSNRINYGLDLLAHEKVRYLFVSGVHEGVTLKKLLQLWGGDISKIDSQTVILGREAGNTLSNALEAAIWVDDYKVQDGYLITSTYHMPRSLLEFRHTVPGTLLVPYAVEPKDFSVSSPYYWKVAFIEYNKFLITLYRILFYPEEVRPLPLPQGLT